MCKKNKYLKIPLGYKILFPFDENSKEIISIQFKDNHFYNTTLINKYTIKYNKLKRVLRFNRGKVSNNFQNLSI